MLCPFATLTESGAVGGKALPGLEVLGDEVPGKEGPSEEAVAVEHFSPLSLSLVPMYPMFIASLEKARSWLMLSYRYNKTPSA